MITFLHIIAYMGCLAAVVGLTSGIYGVVLQIQLHRGILSHQDVAKFGQATLWALAPVEFVFWIAICSLVSRWM